MTEIANKIKERFRLNYKNVALSNKRLGEISTKLAKQIPAESDDSVIDTFLENYNDVIAFSDIQKADDRAANDRINNEKAADDPMALLLTEINSLKEEFTTLRQERTKESLAERFKKDSRLKGVPLFILNKYVPDSDETFDETVEELSLEYKSFAEKEKLSSFGKDYVPGGNGGSKGDIKPLDAAQVADIAKSI